MSKPKIAYADLAWAAAFARIAQGQRFTVNGIEYRVRWKHTEPDWLQLSYATPKKGMQWLMVRQGDDFLLSLK